VCRLFVNRLVPLLKRGSRLVNLSSAGHRFADVDLEDPNFERTPYKEFVAYGRSKTANVLFAVEFDRRHRERGIRAAAVHPGSIQTELGREMTDEARGELMRLIGVDPSAARTAASSFNWKSIPQGAATSVWTAVVADAEAIGGRYCEDCHVAEVVPADAKGRGGVRSYALDPAHARALWNKSEELVGERFG
jgi:NAD(P)-dependent dehydrogenase (short-subunit alcohol dehydrogenase family)